MSEFLAHSSQLSPSPAPPPLYAPNRVLPRFIRLLALYVFLIGGTVGAATAWFYQVSWSMRGRRHRSRGLIHSLDHVQSILYPRLVQRLKLITQLHEHGLVKYDAFADKVVKLAAAKGFRLISPPHDNSPLATAAAEQDSNPAYTVPGSAGEGDALLEKEESTPPDESSETDASSTPAPAILAPLRDSLHQLTNAIQSPPFANQITTAPSAKSSSVSLAASLSALSSLITTQNSVASSMAYRPYIGYNASGTPTVGQGLSQDQLELKEVVTGLKAEIRTVKGALLNRRNFAALPPRAEAVGA